MNFEEFLLACLEKGATEVRLVPVAHDDIERVRFYAHPLNKDGDTVDFEVHENELIKLPFSATSNEMLADDCD